MKHPLRVILLLVLLLALPLRGFAALTDDVASAQHRDGVPTEHAPGMDAIATHQHNADSVSHSDGKSAPTDTYATLCALCGDCCTGAMSGSIFGPNLADIPPTSVAIDFAALPYAGFIPERPERPPRTSLG